MRNQSKHVGQPKFHRPFTLSITRALGDQLFGALAELEPARLDLDHVDEVERRAGVYQLYLNERLIYVGKADRNLRSRLGNHLRKLSGRRGIDLGLVSFTCLYVDEDFTALAPEQLLIDRYRATGGAPWNTNGFGNKDPGRRRDQTAIAANHFDALYQINLDLRLNGLPDGDVPLSEFMAAVKKGVPYTFRYEKLTSASRVDVRSTASMTVHDTLDTIARAYPDEWQIVALPGYVVSYGDLGTDYPSAIRTYTRAGWHDHAPAWSKSTVVASQQGFAEDEEDEVTFDLDER